MCEFKVFLEGEIVMDDVLYAKVEDGKVTLRDIIGDEKVIDGIGIIEVNVISTRIIIK